MSERVCLNCRWCETDPKIAGQGLGKCYFDPPAAFPIQQPGGMMGEISLRPTVRMTLDSCSHFEKRVLVELPLVAKT